MISHSTDPKPYKCENCIQRFSNKSHLKRHIKYMHTEQQFYTCDICSETFNKKCKLLRHSFKHDGKRSYKCYYPYCNKAYFTEGKLSLHIAKHKSEIQTPIVETNEIEEDKKFYKCPHDDCLKTYSTPYNLRVHIKTYHEKLSEYRCFCNQVFKHKCSLDRHRLRHQFEKEDNILSMINF